MTPATRATTVVKPSLSKTKDYFYQCPESINNMFIEELKTREDENREEMHLMMDNYAYSRNERFLRVFNHLSGKKPPKKELMYQTLDYGHIRKNKSVCR